MGKRSRRQKKQTMNSESNANPIFDKSPLVKSPKINKEESYHLPDSVSGKDMKPSATEKSGKITNYFPKSPESRLHPVGQSAAIDTPINQEILLDVKTEESQATNASLPPIGLLTPITTPTKECIQPPARSTHYHHQHQQTPPPETQDSPVEMRHRPKAAQKLDYSAPVSREEGHKDTVARGEGGHMPGGDADTKNKVGKQIRRGKRRSRKSRQAKQVKQVQSPSMTLKDYFPVRRSNRRCKAAIEADEKKMLHDAVLSGREEGVEVKTIVGKGRGVIATKAFNKGDFVVEYYGDHIDIQTAKERENEYAADPSIGCYMYYYQYKNKAYCVDATQESGRIGRLLNHSKMGNCATKLISIDGKPYLILVAAKPISVGEELIYDYGDRNKESLQSHPWLAL